MGTTSTATKSTTRSPTTKPSVSSPKLSAEFGDGILKTTQNNREGQIVSTNDESIILEKGETSTDSSWMIIAIVAIAFSVLCCIGIIGYCFYRKCVNKKIETEKENIGDG